MVSLKNPPADSYAYLEYIGQQGRVRDSISVAGGTFTMKGIVDEPRPAHFLIRKPGEPPKAGNVLHIYIEPGQTVINGESDLVSAKISGSPTTAEFQLLNKQLNIRNQQPIAIRTTTTSMSTNMPGNMRPTRQTNMNGDRIYTSTAPPQRSSVAPPEASAYMAMFGAQHKEGLIKFINANPNSFVSIYLLNNLWKQRQIEFTEFYKLQSGLSPALLNSNQGKVMFNR